MADFFFAQNPGLWAAPNLAGSSTQHFVQSNANFHPTIDDALGAIFANNGEVSAPLGSGAYHIYVLMKKDPASVAGQIITNQLIYAQGSSSAAVVAAGARAFINGVQVTNRIGSFLALNAEFAGNSQWHEVRLENLSILDLVIGRASGDALVGTVRAVVAIPATQLGSVTDVAAIMAKTRAWMLELRPTLPAYPVVPPILSAATISGLPVTGSLLTANYTVGGGAFSTIDFQWKYNGSNITGATFQTISLNEVSMNLFNGGTIACEITATNAGGSVNLEPTIAFVANSSVAQAALENLLVGNSGAGTWNARAAFDTGVLTVPNFAGTAAALTQATLSDKPMISAAIDRPGSRIA